MPTTPYRLHYLGEAALRSPAHPVRDEASVPHDLIRALTDACRTHSAIGLAAQHLGGQDAVIVVTIGGEMVAMVNPRITDQSERRSAATEGSVSMPGLSVLVERPETVTVTYRGEDFAPLCRVLTGLEARCVQHEIDHLNGLLLSDRLPRGPRRAAERAARPYRERAMALNGARRSSPRR